MFVKGGTDIPVLPANVVNVVSAFKLNRMQCDYAFSKHE